jgi:Flp pilus assembly protein TadB
MITMTLTGAAAGAALCFLAWAVLPGRVNHAVTLGRIDAARAVAPGPIAAPRPVQAGWGESTKLRVGRRADTALRRRGLALTRLRQDLAIVDRTMEDHLGSVLAVFAGGLVGGLAAAWLLLAAGLPIPPVSVAPVAVLLGVMLAVARQADVKHGAERRRREFRRALSAYLDLVAMSLIGGTGLPEALPSAARVGRGWPFLLIGEALGRARALGRSAWAEFSDLGGQIGVDEFRDLAAALALVGEEGARISTTLIARASTLRRRDIADVEGRAKERDTSMRVAMVVISFGFLLFLLYPAVTNILNS